MYVDISYELSTLGWFLCFSLFHASAAAEGKSPGGHKPALVSLLLAQSTCHLRLWPLYFPYCYISSVMLLKTGFIFSCLLDVAVSAVVQHVLWTILLETEQFPGVLCVTLMWHVVGFISLEFVFVDVSVFLLLFLALIVPSHLPWV